MQAIEFAESLSPADVTAVSFGLDPDATEPHAFLNAHESATLPTRARGPVVRERSAGRCNSGQSTATSCEGEKSL